MGGKKKAAVNRGFKKERRGVREGGEIAILNIQDCLTWLANRGKEQERKDI